MANEETVFGIHAVRSIIKRDRKRIKAIYLGEKHNSTKLNLIAEDCKQQHIPLSLVSKRELDALSQGQNHQGVVASVLLKKAENEAALKQHVANLAEPAFFLILDGVTDPHNLGACLRTADAAGIHGIIMPKDNAVSINATVSKVACGAADNVPVYQVTNLARTLRMLKDEGIWVYGAAGEAEDSVYDTALTGPIAIVMGSEGSGLRQNTKKHCDHLIKIPMTGTVESLNVSVASAVVIFEAFRQRSTAPGLQK